MANAAALDRQQFGAEVTDSHHATAIEAVLADMDTFCDYVGSECWNQDNVNSDSVLSPRRSIEQATTAEVLHCLLTATADEHIRACRDELVRRHLANKADYIARKAGELTEVF